MFCINPQDAVLFVSGQPLRRDCFCAYCKLTGIYKNSTINEVKLTGDTCYFGKGRVQSGLYGIDMTLDQVKPGYAAILSVIGGEGALRRHLLDMGLKPNTRVTVRKVAPMGDPIELFLRGYVLTLRREDAAKIEVVQVEKA